MAVPGSHMCPFPDCTRRVPSNAYSQFCREHRPEHEAAARPIYADPICREPGCTKGAKHSMDGAPGGKKLYCIAHMRARGMRPHFSTCMVEGCIKRRSACLSDGSRMYCIQHMRELGLEPRRPVCQHPGCDRTMKTAEGGTRMYCSVHLRVHGMIPQRRKGCQHDGCAKLAKCSTDGKYTYCIQHMKEHGLKEQVYRCSEAGCERPVWTATDGTRKWCVRHTRQNGKEPKQRTCREPGCEERAQLNSERKRRYCDRHMLMHGQLPAKPRCTQQGCTRGVAFQGASLCKTHMRGTQIVPTGRHDCQHPGCTRLAKRSMDNQLTYCKAHMFEYGMYPKTSCKEAGCNRVAQPDKEGKCVYCHLHMQQYDVQPLAPGCEEADCGLPAQMDETGETKYCEAHMVAHARQPKATNCTHAGCHLKVTASVDGTPSRFCVRHLSLQPSTASGTAKVPCQFPACAKSAKVHVNGVMKYCFAHSRQLGVHPSQVAAQAAAVATAADASVMNHTAAPLIARTAAQAQANGVAGSNPWQSSSVGSAALRAGPSGLSAVSLATMAAAASHAAAPAGTNANYAAIMLSMLQHQLGGDVNSAAAISAALAGRAIGGTTGLAGVASNQPSVPVPGVGAFAGRLHNGNGTTVQGLPGLSTGLTGLAPAGVGTLRSNNNVPVTSSPGIAASFPRCVNAGSGTPPLTGLVGTLRRATTKTPEPRTARKRARTSPGPPAPAVPAPAQSGQLDMNNLMLSPQMTQALLEQALASLPSNALSAAAGQPPQHPVVQTPSIPNTTTSTVASAQPQPQVAVPPGGAHAATTQSMLPTSSTMVDTTHALTGPSPPPGGSGPTTAAALAAGTAVTSGIVPGERENGGCVVAGVGQPSTGQDLVDLDDVVADVGSIPLLEDLEFGSEEDSDFDKGADAGVAGPGVGADLGLDSDDESTEDDEEEEEGVDDDDEEDEDEEDARRSKRARKKTDGGAGGAGRNAGGLKQKASKGTTGRGAAGAARQALLHDQGLNHATVTTATASSAGVPFQSSPVPSHSWQPGTNTQTVALVPDLLPNTIVTSVGAQPHPGSLQSSRLLGASHAAGGRVGAAGGVRPSLSPAAIPAHFAPTAIQATTAPSSQPVSSGTSPFSGVSGAATSSLTAAPNTQSTNAMSHSLPQRTAASVSRHSASRGAPQSAAGVASGNPESSQQHIAAQPHMHVPGSQPSTRQVPGGGAAGVFRPFEDLSDSARADSPALSEGTRQVEALVEAANALYPRGPAQPASSAPPLSQTASFAFTHAGQGPAQVPGAAVPAANSQASTHLNPQQSLPSGQGSLPINPSSSVLSGSAGSGSLDWLRSNHDSEQYSDEDEDSDWEDPSAARPPSSAPFAAARPISAATSGAGPNSARGENQSTSTLQVDLEILEKKCRYGACRQPGVIQGGDGTANRPLRWYCMMHYRLTQGAGRVAMKVGSSRTVAGHPVVVVEDKPRCNYANCTKNAALDIQGERVYCRMHIRELMSQQQLTRPANADSRTSNSAVRPATPTDAAIGTDGALLGQASHNASQPVMLFALNWPLSPST